MLIPTWENHKRIFCRVVSCRVASCTVQHNMNRPFIHAYLIVQLSTFPYSHLPSRQNQNDSLDPSFIHRLPPSARNRAVYCILSWLCFLSHFEWPAVFSAVHTEQRYKNTRLSTWRLNSRKMIHWCSGEMRNNRGYRSHVKTWFQTKNRKALSRISAHSLAAPCDRPWGRPCQYTYPAPAIKMGNVMPYGQLIAVCSEIHIKHKRTVWRECRML
jgi:hypothetical protein